MAAMGAMVAGFYSVEFITNNMIPITARHFTDNAFTISLIVALNRLFGFLVQPYVSWKSDHIQTRFGRRRPFLMIGLPATFVCVLAVGAMPFLFEGESRHALPVLILFFTLNVALQAFVDMNWGSHEPLYADTFKHKVLGRAVALRSWGINIVTLFMTLYALKLADRNQFLPYLWASIFVLMSLVIVVFIIRERPAPAPIKARYNPLSHLRLLFTNADYAKIAIIGGVQIMENAAYMLFLSLFAKRTLGLTLTQYGYALSLGPIVAFLISLPAGWLVDRFGPKPVLCLGFAVFGINSALMAFWVHDFSSFVVLQIIYAAASATVSLPLTSMVFQYASPDERGRIYGLYQFTRGFSAFVFSLVLGSLVQYSTSSDPTPMYPDDIKKTGEFMTMLGEQEAPVAQAIWGNLSPQARQILAQPYVDQSELGKQQKQVLTDELNAMMDKGGFAETPAFQTLLADSPGAAKLLQEDKPGQRFIAHRVLLHAAFPDHISKNVDFRIGYMLDVILAFTAFFVVLSTRRGKYAQTMKDD